MKNNTLSKIVKDIEHTTRRANVNPGYLYIRLDGRGFSKFTKTMIKPYDTRMANCMIETSKKILKSFHADYVYTQSDEISVLFKPRLPENEWMFGGRIDKWLSLVASQTTAFFIQSLLTNGLGDYVEKAPHFDARLCDGLTKTEAADFLKWRADDARRNAIQMLAQHHFPKKSLHNQNLGILRQRLIEKGLDFDTQPHSFQNGTLLFTQKHNIPIEDRHSIPESHRPSNDIPIYRQVQTILNTPLLTQIENLETFLFPEETL